MHALLLLSLFSCGPKTADVPPPAGLPTPDAEGSVPDLRIHMTEHFAHLDAARWGFVMGDQAMAARELDWIFSHNNAEDLPEGWHERVADMRRAASAARDAEDLQGTAAGIAALGASCGSCHAWAGAEVVLPEGPPPPWGEPGLQGHMARHRWAVDRLWQGLLGPSDDAWAAGLVGLQEMPLGTSDLAGDAEELAHESQALADRVHELSEAGGQAADLDARAKVYGELLEVCADCHKQVRGL
ncbi:MAG: hypothetical protein H6739_08920 [Alphaproteobacteria bacterium]|nr:hypothetical protein [Alphaproteobacteria bacterium]